MMKTNQLILTMMREFFTVSFGIIAVTLLLGSNVHAQKKLYLSTGVGYPELMNMAMSFKLGQTKFGVNYGANESSTSVSGDVSFMLAKEEPMFFKMGVSKLGRELESSADEYIYLNLRLGKEWNISRSKLKVSKTLNLNIQS